MAVVLELAGNACGLCRGVVAGEGVLDLLALAFTRGWAGLELGPVMKPEPELESRKLEPELEFEGKSRVGREGTLALAPILAADEDGVEGTEEVANEPLIRVFTGIRVCISEEDDSGDGETILRRIPFELGGMRDDLGVVSDDVELEAFGDSWVVGERRRGIEEEVVRLD